MEDIKKESNKIKRKLSRCINIIQKDHPDICPSQDPTKFVLLGNAGLTTNVDEVSIAELINSIGSGLQAITLLPGKSYSFASFFDAKNAELILNEVNGRQSVRGSTSPIYMSYVNKVPCVSSAVKYELPPGLRVLEDFITKEEEEVLLKVIDWEESPQGTAEGSVMKHRQVRHFGYEFKYGTNSVDKDQPLPQRIPEALSPVVKRIVEMGIMSEPPDQLTVNRYLPGQGIPPHVDTHCSFTDEVLSLSIGSGITMDFRSASHIPSESLKNPPHCAVYLKPRSLCAMMGPSRYEWTHGICPRMTDVVPSEESSVGLRLCPRQERVSFTFRKIRQGDCHCGNPLVCDNPDVNRRGNSSDKACSRSDFNGNSAEKLEKEHVLAVYDQIANHFSDTRHKPWPHVLEFVSSLSPGSFLLDVGCGNGKYLGHNTSVVETGCDTSFELTKICKDRGFEVLNCNCLQLPYRSCSFDAVICIAVIHHLASEERRLAAVQEIARVLRVGGRGLIYVWAMEQKRGKKKSSYLKQNKANRKEENEESVGIGNSIKGDTDVSLDRDNLPVHTNRTEFVEQDMLVPWKLKPQKNHGKKTASSNGSSTLNNSSSSSETPNVVSSGTAEVNQESVPVFHRFYHVFKQSELESLCEGIEGLSIHKSYYDEGNWCVIFEKS